jgi:hypothetical protein
MNFCPESKNSIIVKTARYDRIINELCHFYKVPLIKTFIEPIASFHEIQKITKISFNIPCQLWDQKKRFCIRFPQNGMTGERHRLSLLSL